ncbi:flagellar biosynthesis protein FlgJ [Legionella nagasakiensis]|uniref:flagellar biosynthesis protein FlgJ n=1 Tax=Legionella nagasakiensis TaxID=535290 RepID=UPI001F5FE96E|nr:flagellar biosynthesis protein FlgJ [Legionella nagasakiensis]
MRKIAIGMINLFEMLRQMDVAVVEVILHPKAKNYLFEHFQTLRQIFSDVLGQVETDYLSIALINEANQIFFLSSHPSIEQNLIEHNLWIHDGSFQPAFIYQDEPRLWADLYHPEHAQELYCYKQADQRLASGFSMPTDYAGYRVVFSFGFRSADITIEQQAPIQLKKFMAMGNFCLRKIIESIPMLDKTKFSNSKPHLRLITNNKVPYENTTG